MNRTEYLEAARDNALQMALEIRLEELELPPTRRGSLRRKRTRLTDRAGEFQREIIVIDARLVVVNRPTSQDKANMIELRNRVRDATRNRLALSAMLALADEVLGVIDELRAVA